MKKSYPGLLGHLIRTHLCRCWNHVHGEQTTEKMNQVNVVHMWHTSIGNRVSAPKYFLETAKHWANKLSLAMFNLNLYFLALLFFGGSGGDDGGGASGNLFDIINSNHFESMPLIRVERVPTHPVGCEKNGPSQHDFE